MVSEDQIQEVRNDYEKKIAKLKKVAEVQMRNVKVLAKDKAKTLLDETVNRLKRYF